MKNWNEIILWLLILRFSGSLCGTRQTKPFINEFFFKLSSEDHLPRVKMQAENLQFKWLQQVITRLHLFRKLDIPINNEKPVSGSQITRWMNSFGNTLEYIEQDQYIQVYPSKEEQSDFPFPGTQSPQAHFQSTHSHKPSTRPTNVSICVVSTDTCQPINIAVLDAFFETEHQNLKNNIVSALKRCMGKTAHSNTARLPPISHLCGGMCLCTSYDAGLTCTKTQITDFHFETKSIGQVKELAHNFVDGNGNPRPDEFPDDYMEEMFPEDYIIFSHGTMCMGRIAASTGHGCSKGGNNNASIVPLKFIDKYGYRRNKDEIAALEYMNNEIDIYSCSYGTVENIGFPATKKTHIEEALARGVSEGRYCKGSIYVFPSGNGNADGKLDNCNTDIYANSIHTITIASITMSYQLTEETETCPCALVASFGFPAPQKGLYMNTTIPKNKCTFGFKGGSASTAYAAGLISHALRENQNFSKRDIEHLLVQTAKKDMDPEIKWETNGVGHRFNEKIGFGAIDLFALKAAAKSWKHVPEKRRCIIDAGEELKEIVSGKPYIKEYQIQSDACQNKTNFVKHLEHIQIELEMSCSNISNIGINLISPMGTKVGLLTKITVRSDRNVQYEKFQWTFMAVLFWGEDPRGDWKLEMLDSGTDAETAEMHVKKLILHGTGVHPSTGGQPLYCKEETFQENGLSTAVIVVIIVAVIVIVIVIVIIFCIRCPRCRPCIQNSDAVQTNESRSRYDPVRQTVDINIEN